MGRIAEFLFHAVEMLIFGQHRNGNDTNEKQAVEVSPSTAENQEE